jgi:hypothetical protein
VRPLHHSGCWRQISLDDLGIEGYFPMPTKSGGDPPQQQILEFEERLAPKGLLAEATLAQAGFDDPKDAAKKLRGAGLDLAPSADGPAKRRGTAAKATEKAVGGAQPAPAYTDEVKSEASILPPRSYWRRRTGPTQSEEFGLLSVIGDVARRYHLARWAVGASIFVATCIAGHGSTNRDEPVPARNGGWTVEVKPEWRQ